MNSAPPRPSLPLWKKLLFGPGFVLSLFLVAELVLAVAGVRPGLETGDPYVGFSGQLPLFEKVQGADGEILLRTSERKLKLFNPQEFPLRKEPGTTRIFCLGGSTTYGRPYHDPTSFAGWLRSYLVLADPDHHYEVINAGGISYASYRVAVLMEELAEYSPDLFVIYTGQNEFLERRTYRDLEKTAPWVRRLDLLFGHTRTYTVLQGWIRKVRASAARRSDDVPSSGATQLAPEVRTILDGSVGPRDYYRDDVLHADILAHYRFNLERMVGIADRVGAAVIFVNPASNLAACTPFKSDFQDATSPAAREEFEKSMADARVALDRSELGRSEELARHAVQLDDRRADAHYLLGRILQAAGRSDDAKREFVRARDEDVCPLRAPTGFGAVVRELAEERKLPLVDFESLVESRSPDGIPGADLFLDHVHPTIEGNRLLGEALVEEMVRDGMIHPGPGWTPEGRERVEAQVLAGVDVKENARALLNLSKVLQWAGKFEDSQELAERAMAMDPDDAASQLQLALARQHEGDLEGAAGLMTEALQRYPDSADLHAALGGVRLEQGEPALAREELERADALHPDDPGILNNLGLALQEGGKPGPAREVYTRIHSLDPGDARSWNNQGTLDLAEGNFESALASYGRALELSPKYESALYGQGVALGQMHRDQEAMRSFERVLVLDPEHVDARYALAVLLRRTGDTDGAIAGFEEVLRLDPDHAAARQQLAHTRGN